MRKTDGVRTVLTEDPVEAAAFIMRGGVVAFPTETVYGLGADVFDEAAIARIFDAKQRPADNPLIAHVFDLDQIHLLAAAIPTHAQKLIDSFFPGPLTVVLHKTDKVPLIATAGLATIGIRMPRFELAHRFLASCGTPVAAPSANVSGRPSPTTWQAVAEDLDGRIDCILQGAATEIGLESTVVDCTAAVPVVLRSGSVTIEQIRDVIPEIESADSDDTGISKSPGVRHAHYSPRARVTRGMGEQGPAAAAAYIGISSPTFGFGFEKIVDDVDSYARSLFEFFRECDRRGLGTIYCEPVVETGVGAALMDRIRRAASG